jgi:hypothetical protein
VFLGNFGEWPYGATTAAVLQQFLFHAARAPFKALASFNFVKIFRMSSAGR